MINEKIKLASEKLSKALIALEKVVENPMDPDKNNRDATIKRFEFTFELFWKLLKTLLEKKGLELRFPADIFKEAYMGHLIDEEKTWLAMLKDRNLTSHTYDEKLADEIYLRIKQYTPIFRKSFSKLKTMKDNGN